VVKEKRLRDKEIVKRKRDGKQKKELREKGVVKREK
jgi:hypothetical protein